MLKVQLIDRKFEKSDIDKLSEHEQEVISYYKWITKNEFYRSDVILLKKMLTKNMPKQICSIIKQAHVKREKDLKEGKENNFTDFKYLYSWVMSLNLRSKSR